MLVAVHGRTRDQKDLSATRADWAQIRAVKQALRVPVLANGNIRHLGDVAACLEATGCDGVLSAEGLLADPALFAPRRAPVAVGDVSGGVGDSGRKAGPGRPQSCMEKWGVAGHKATSRSWAPVPAPVPYLPPVPSNATLRHLSYS